MLNFPFLRAKLLKTPHFFLSQENFLGCSFPVLPFVPAAARRCHVPGEAQGDFGSFSREEEDGRLPAEGNAAVALSLAPDLKSLPRFILMPCPG